MDLRNRTANWKGLVAFAAGFSVFAFGVSAQPEQDAAREAIARCAALPDESFPYSDTLKNEGWTRVTDTGVLPNMLFSSNFVATADPAAPKASVDSATFLAMSVLGGSNLGPNQPVYQFGDLLLAPLGLATKKPWCLLTGPAWLTDIAKKTLTTPLVAWTSIPTIETREVLREPKEYGHILLTTIDVERFSAIATPAGAESLAPRLAATHLTITTKPMSLGKPSE